MRIPVRSLPITNPLLTTIKQNLLTDVRNNYQNSVQTQQPVTTTTTNVVQQKTNTSNNILTTNKIANVQNCTPTFNKYQNYTSITPEENKYTLSAVTDYVKTLTLLYNERLLTLVYLMAQTYNKSSSSFVCYNNNLGNISLDVTSGWGGNLADLFENQFICLTNDANNTGSFAVFSTKEKGIQFVYKKFIKKIYTAAVTNNIDSDIFSQQFVKQLILDTSGNNDITYYDTYKKTNQSSVTEYEKVIKNYYNLVKNTIN
jgi:hypothetical protein